MLTRAEASDPIEFSRVVLDALAVQQRLRRQPSREHSDRRAVLRRHVVKEIGGPQTSRAGHVLGNDGGVSGKMLAEVASEGPHMDVVIGARRQTHDDGGRLLCDRAPELCEYGGDGERPQEHSTSLHGRVRVLQWRAFQE